MSRIDKLLDEYWDRFGDMFPTMNFQDEELDSICDRIEQCLQKGKKAEELFELNYDYKY